MDLWTIYQEPLFWLFPVGGNLISMMAFLLFAGPMTWAAKRDVGWLRSYKIQDRQPRHKDMISKSIKSWLINNLWMVAISVAVWPLLRLSGVHLGEWPPWYVILLQLLFFIYLDDALYYVMHRSLHQSRWLFKRVHSVHHRIGWS